MKPIAFFDLETTGTDKLKDRIVEIAIIRSDNGQEYHTLVKPGIDIPKAASDIHGITDAKVAGSPTFKMIAKTIIEFIDGCDLGGYNSNSFDIPLLYCELVRAGIALDLSKILFIDVCNIFKRREERTLTAAMKFYCSKNHEDAHGALADVKATMEVFEAQKYVYPDLAKMDQSEIAVYCNYDNERADLSGNFTIDADKDYVLNFGKHRGRKAKDCKDYLQWMQGQDFMPDTKQIISNILSQ